MDGLDQEMLVGADLAEGAQVEVAQGTLVEGCSGTDGARILLGVGKGLELGFVLGALHTKWRSIIIDTTGLQGLGIEEKKMKKGKRRGTRREDSKSNKNAEFKNNPAKSS